MSATGIVALFSGLSAASSGAHGSVAGLLNMLSAMRYAFVIFSFKVQHIKHAFRFLLGIGIGAEYPCGSVSASEQSEEPGVSKGAQHRWFVLATSKRMSCCDRIPHWGCDTDTMIDFGFVVSAFVPLVLFWMYVLRSWEAQSSKTFNIALETIIFVLYGVSPLASVLFPHWEYSYGVSTWRNQLVTERIPWNMLVFLICSSFADMEVHWQLSHSHGSVVPQIPDVTVFSLYDAL